MKKIRIGTRGSKLALKQASLVQEALFRTADGTETEIIVIHTKGDKMQDKPLSEIGDKGVFASELEQALLGGEIDLAVHSAKDLPAALAEGLTIAAVLPRADVRDVLVIPKNGRMPVPVRGGPGDGKRPAKEGETANTPDRGFVVGTGSRRRQQQACEMWENVILENIRGNVDTRLRKLGEGGGAAGMMYDGIILAKAGLDRLETMSGYEDIFECHPLAPEEFLPAACQGIIAVEAARCSEAALLCRKMTDAETEFCFRVEREVLAHLSADCREAAAAWCRRAGDLQCRSAAPERNRQRRDRGCAPQGWILDAMYAGNRIQLAWETAFSTEAGDEKGAGQLGESLKVARRAAELVRDKKGKG